MNKYKIRLNPNIVFSKYIEEILLDLFINHLLDDEINTIISFGYFYNIYPKNSNVELYEPKRVNRFLVNFPKDILNIESWFVQTIDKPKFKDDKWLDIEITFIDPIGNASTARELFNLAKNLNNVTNFSIEIEDLDPVGNVISKWIIIVDKVVLIEFGYNDYGNDGLLTPKLILEPLDCILHF